MKYKALEDLINILVKKSGTDLSVQVVANEVLRLETKKEEVKSKIEKLKQKIEEDTYVLNINKDKDLNEKNYLEEQLNLLVEEKENLYKELDSFSKLGDEGEICFVGLSKELEQLKCRAHKLKIKLEMNLDDENEFSSEYLKLCERIKEIQKELNRKQILEENILRIDEEINYIKDALNSLDSKIDKMDYRDGLSISKDKLELNSLEEDKKSIDRSIESWQSSAEVLGAKILDAFKSEKVLDDVKSDIERLVDMANTELKETREEIRESNIFQVMDNYDKLSVTVKDKVINNNYKDDLEKESVLVKVNYHKEKISKFKESLESINYRRNEVLNLISISRNLSEEIQRNRINKEENLTDLEKRLYDLNTIQVSDDELNNIENLIDEIRLEISNDKYLENEYIDDIYSFKEELKNLDINYATLENEISKEEKILDILNTKFNSSDFCVDKLEKLKDMVQLIEHNNKLVSLKNQQQYLYVDTKVIKDEIYSIWTQPSKSKNEEKVEKVKKEVVLSQEIEDSYDDIEVFDDFEFDVIDE